MIVENESNWSTEDLQALLERVLESPGFKLKTAIDKKTLILFKTHRSRTTRACADWDPWSYQYYDTMVINIKSANKLRTSLLDQLAQVTNDTCKQDMSSENVAVVAHVIAQCLDNRHSATLSDFRWAKTMSLRSRSKITYGKVAMQRERAILNMRRNETITKFNKSIDKIDKRLSRLGELEAKGD